MNKRQLGSAGEQMAAEYLLEKGYKILHQNYRCFLGEIDLICEKDQLIIFVEVKTRRSANFGLAKEAVNYSKQQKIHKLAQYYLQSAKTKFQPRFDVLEVYPTRVAGQKAKIVHLPGAF